VIDGGAHVALADAIAVADEHLNPKTTPTCERLAVSIPEREAASQSHPQVLLCGFLFAMPGPEG
jgi:hypothetical protein